MNFRRKIEEALGEKIISSNSIGGGCIADSNIVVAESGKRFFLKKYSGNNSDILQSEANGLRELAKGNAIRVPKVILLEKEFLLLENITTGRKGKNFSEDFGRGFARLHKYYGDSFGFRENNFIGSNPQINLPKKENWIEFYWENRLMFQFRLAEKNGYVTSELKKLFFSLENNIEGIIRGSEEAPSLLHGDLWGGNYMVDEEGNPVLIDPAVYYGHREADLAMTKLFGGFDSRFYSSYEEFFPLPDGSPEREELYKLYHVMNHLNLFGTGYLSQTISILKRYS